MTLDLTPLWRSSVGFDPFDRLFEHAFNFDDKSTGYPPYNIVNTSETDYQISLAVAGFNDEEIEITTEGSSLVVKGDTKIKEDKTSYLYKGIAARNFERRFELADTIKVVGANLVNGLLHIDLVRKIPEQEKAKKIKIGNLKKISC